MIHTQLSYTDFDALTIEFINTKLFEKERYLYKTKWWDVKNLHPLDATYMFAESYKHAMKEAIKRRKCLFRGINYKGLKHDDFLSCSKQVITGMWKARQQADMLGIEYSFYCNAAMRYAEERDHKFLPGPSQLYSTKPKLKDDLSMVEYIYDKWLAANNNRLLHAQSQFYSMSVFSKNRYQIEHQRFLLNAIRRKPSMKHVLIAELVYRKRLIGAEAIERAFPNGESLVRQAEKFFNH